MTEQEVQRQEVKKVKQTDKLIKSVMDLEKRLTKDAKDAEKGTGSFSWKKGIREGLGKTRDVLSDRFSLKGIAGMVGIKEGGFIGDLLAARHESKREAKDIAKTQAKEAHQAAKAFQKYGTEASSMRERGVSENDILKKGIELYKQKLEIEKKIQIIEDERKEARSFDEKFDTKNYKKDEYELLKKQQATIYSPGKMAPGDIVKKKEKLSLPKDEEKQMRTDIREYMMTSMNLANKAVIETEKQTGPLSDEHRSELVAGVKGGIDEELLKLSKEQLKALQAIVKNSEMTEEDKLEAMGKVGAPPEKKSGASRIMGAVKEKAGGLIEKAVDLVGSIKGIAPVLAQVASFAGPALAVAGAGAAGAYVGTKINEHALNPLAEKITGTKGETVGTALYGAVDKVQGWFGKGDADKAKVSEATSQAEFVIQRIETGTPISKELYDKVKKNSKLLPVELRNKLEKALPGATIAGTLEKPQTAEAAKVESVPVDQTLEKPPVVSRAAQLQTLEAEAAKNVDLLETKKMAEREQAPSATVVNTSTVNNTTKETRISPPVRNVDTTFNDRLGMSFGY